MNTTMKLTLMSLVIPLVLAGCGMTPKHVAPAPEPEPIATPEPEPEPMPEPEPEPAPIYVLEDVHFDFDKATLKPEGMRKLDEVAAGLKTQPDVPYEVAGHTDSIGTEAYNQALSERRATTVREYLVSRGVPAQQLVTRGYGESSPIASNATPAGRAENRRVEVKPR